MRPLRTIALVSGAAALFVGLLVTPASAAPYPTGTLCGFASSDLTSPGNQFGVLFGGPVVLRDDASPAVVYSGSLTCTFQWGIFNGSHSAPDTCVATSPTATGIVTVATPNTCAFNTAGGGDPWDISYVCTQVDIVGGPTLYWASPSVGIGYWTTDSSAPCATSATMWLDDWLVQDLASSVLDPVLCPVLQPFFPPDGDVGIFYDCPPEGPHDPLFEYIVYVWPPEVAAV